MIEAFFVSAILAAFFLSFLPSAAPAASWGDLIKDRLCMSVPRMIEGRVFLDEAISGATIRIYNRDGLFLREANAATGEDGSFSLTCPLPESFKIVISGGLKGDEPFEHEISRYIENFDETTSYKVNAVTNLVSAYRDDHVDVSPGEAETAVKKFLSLPESVNLDEVIYSSEWYCYYFSHYLFMKEAKLNHGMSSFVNQLVDEMDAGRSRSFYDGDSIGSSYFNFAMAALLRGAVSKLGGEGTGWILGLLNQGGDIDNRLAEMKSDLEAILSDLAQIINALKALAQELALDMNDVETYIEGLNAQEAITTIKTHYGPDDPDSRGDTNTLKWFSFCTSTDSDPTTKAEIKTLVENINGTWDIEEQVQAIHDAIFPDIGNTDGLLDLWTKNFLLQGPVGSDKLMDYYKTLEQYFSVLLFYQFKGANMVVEALNYTSGSGEVPATSGLWKTDGDTPTPAESYLTGTFQPMIKEETDRFLQCVVRLLASNCGLYWEKNFLPGTAREILARATFFIIQTLGEDHYGLRTGFFGTANLINDILASGAAIDDGDNTYFVSDAGEKVDADLPDRPYDCWGTLSSPDLATLTQGTTYTLLKAYLGRCLTDPAPYVKYTTDNTYWNNLGSAAMKTYTDQYVEDPDGTIWYGYFLAPFRVGGREAVMDPSVFKRQQYTSDHSGDVNRSHSDSMNSDGNLSLKLSASNEYENSASSITQALSWGHVFKYGGTESVTAYVNIAGYVSGSTSSNDGTLAGNESSISLHAGLWDSTHSKHAGWIDYGKTAPENGKADLSKQINDQLKVTLEPGVTYQAYAKVNGSGQNDNGDYSYEIHLDTLTHLSVTFVDIEY